MGVDQFAKLSIGDGPVVDVSVGAKSGLKGSYPTPNAVPAPQTRRHRFADSASKGEKPREKLRGGRDKGGDKGDKGGETLAANGAGETADREPREGGKIPLAVARENKSAPGSNAADVGVEVRHKVVERNAPPRPIPSPKGSTAGADGAPSDAVEPHGAPCVVMTSAHGEHASDAKHARGVIPLPKGHVALDGAPAPAPAVAGEKKTSKRGGKRRDASGEARERRRRPGARRPRRRRPPPGVPRPTRPSAPKKARSPRRRRRTTARA